MSETKAEASEGKVSLMRKTAAGAEREVLINYSALCLALLAPRLGTGPWRLRRDREARRASVRRMWRGIF